ncbi:hypothetical protein K501DRAFT_287962 [Backusella circina FSU 941]|nr:hypothetical protein K501DRAFT_287962 [Backusella circina FSU 941]
MMVDWVYASGSSWVSFDKDSQQQIETLWRNNGSTWIISPCFQGPVFVDTSEMFLMYGSFSYTIARRVF